MALAKYKFLCSKSLLCALLIVLRRVHVIFAIFYRSLTVNWCSGINYMGQGSAGDITEPTIEHVDSFNVISLVTSNVVKDLPRHFRRLNALISFLLHFFLYSASHS